MTSDTIAKWFKSSLTIGAMAVRRRSDRTPRFKPLDWTDAGAPVDPVVAAAQSRRVEMDGARGGKVVEIPAPEIVRFLETEGVTV